ncbi:MAG: hypothetical protein IT384_24760 [Deltaproteobacteria bacterium]|nr:hypothetical protein [Deltaproteobacteria bacterium]
MAIPKKVAERIVAGLRKYQPIIANAKARDVNESDRVMLATDEVESRPLEPMFSSAYGTDFVVEHRPGIR